MKILSFYKTHTWLELVRKIFFVLSRTIEFNLLKKLRVLIYFGSKNVTIGKNVNLSGLGLKSIIEKNFIIYNDCKFELGEDARLTVGSNVVFSYGVILCCRHKVTIGNDVQIGEYTSIRDTSHDYSELGVPMKYNPDFSKEIVIGNNVWIGRGCMILPGSVIEDGVVIGANSVVKGTIKTESIYAGVPARFIAFRNP